MALWTGKNTLKPDSRSRIGALQIGEHESPAEDWVVDPTLPVVLKNPYGGQGMEDVVVPMGRLVAVTSPVQVYTGKMKTALTLANGTNAVVGVAPYNFVKDNSNSDRFGGNKPAVITDKYIRLPYIPNDRDDSPLCPWGHVTGTGIAVGDWLMSTANGQYMKWDGLDANQRVGQILAQDFNQEMMGWLKMAMWQEAAKMEDEIFQNYYNQAPQPNGGAEGGQYSTLYPYNGYAYNANYKDGTIDMAKYGYLSPYQTKFHGIPGLSDGANRALTTFTGESLKEISPDTGMFTTFSGYADGDVIVFQVVDKSGGAMLDLQTLTVYVDGVAIVAGAGNGQYAVNMKTGVITIKALAAWDGLALTADFTTTFYGTPSYIDFQGAIGVFNVLLKL